MVAVDAAFDGARSVDTRFDQGQPTRLNRIPTIRLQTVPTKNGMHPLARRGIQSDIHGHPALAKPDVGSHRRVLQTTVRQHADS